LGSPVEEEEMIHTSGKEEEEMIHTSRKCDGG
jgi:hypothetical protein